MKERLALMACCLILFAPTSRAEKPIVAVFDFENRGVDLKPTTLEHLSAYLVVLLAESGFQVIPREDVRDRLLAKKKDSYQTCYDRACQVELGRELAAQKYLSTGVFKIGAQCRVTATLFDLRRSVTEKATSATADCSEESLLAAMGSIVATLSEARPVLDEPPARKVVVDINTTEPAWAEVFVDGKTAGYTPLRIELPEQSRHQLILERKYFKRLTKNILIDGKTKLSYKLDVTEGGLEANKYRREWIGLSPFLGFALNGARYGGLQLEAITLKWPHLTYSIIDASIGFGDLFFIYLGTKIGYTLYFGAQSKHQVRVGLAAGLGLLQMTEAISASDSFQGEKGLDTIGLVLVPSLNYRYHTDWGGYFGLGVQSQLIVLNHYFSDFWNDQTLDDHFPATLMFSLQFGWGCNPLL